MLKICFAVFDKFLDIICMLLLLFFFFFEVTCLLQRSIINKIFSIKNWCLWIKTYNNKMREYTLNRLHSITWKNNYWLILQIWNAREQQLIHYLWEIVWTYLMQSLVSTAALSALLLPLAPLGTKQVAHSDIRFTLKSGSMYTIEMENKILTFGQGYAPAMELGVMTSLLYFITG